MDWWANPNPDTIFEAVKLLNMQDSFTGRKKKIEDKEEDKDSKGASANTCNRTSFTNSIYLLTQGIRRQTSKKILSS